MKATKWGLSLAFVALAVVSLAGCTKDTSASVYVPTAADVTATATLAELQQGRTYYVNNCDRCHSLYAPESFTASQWKSLLPGMTSRTGLSAADIALLTKYVTKGQ